MKTTLATFALAALSDARKLGNASANANQNAAFMAWSASNNRYYPSYNEFQNRQN
jgi:hypothetical protein